MHRSQVSVLLYIIAIAMPLFIYLSLSLSTLLYISVCVAAKLRDVEVLCQENEGEGGDCVKKVCI